MWAILWQVIQRFWLLEDNVAEEVTDFHPYITEEHLEPTQMYGFLHDDVFILSCLLLLVCPFFLEFHRLLQTEISHHGYDTKEFTRRKKRVRNRSKSWRDGLLQTKKVHNMKPMRRPKILPLFSMESIKNFAFFLMAKKVTPATTETPTVEQENQCLHNKKEKTTGLRKPKKEALKKKKKQPETILWSQKNRYGHGLGFHGFGVTLRPRPSLTDTKIFVCQNMKSGQTKLSPSSEPETPPEVSVHKEKVILVRQKEETARPIPCPTTQDHSKITCPHSRSICSCGCGRNPRLEITEQLMAEFLKELEKVKNQTKAKFSNVTNSRRGDSSERKTSQLLSEQMDNQRRTMIETSARDFFNIIPRNIAGDQRFSGQRALAIESIDGKESRCRVTPEQNDKKKQDPKRDQKQIDSRYNIQDDDPSCCPDCFSFIFG